MIKKGIRAIHVGKKHKKTANPRKSSSKMSLSNNITSEIVPNVGNYKKSDRKFRLVEMGEDEQPSHGARVAYEKAEGRPNAIDEMRMEYDLKFQRLENEISALKDLMKEESSVNFSLYGPQAAQSIFADVVHLVHALEEALIRKYLKGFLRKFGSFKRLEAVSSKKVSNAKKLESFWKKADVKLVWQIVNSEEFQDAKEMRNDMIHPKTVDLAGIRSRVNLLKQKQPPPRTRTFDRPVAVLEHVENIRNLNDLLKYFNEAKK